MDFTYSQLMEESQDNFSFMDLLMNSHDDVAFDISAALIDVESVTIQDFADNMPLTSTGIAAPFPDNVKIDNTVEMGKPYPGPSDEAQPDISPSFAQNKNDMSTGKPPCNDILTYLCGDVVNCARNSPELKDVCPFINQDSTATNPSPFTGVATFFENVCKDVALERDTSPPTMDSDTDSYTPPSMARNSSGSVSETLLELEKKMVCKVQPMQREMQPMQQVQQVQRGMQSHERPPLSFVALISTAILSTPEKKMVVDEIFHYVSDRFSYYKMEQQNWKDSIRYNLSMHECFRQVGRDESGRGNYWAVDPDCEDDFRNGDYRRRQPRKRCRRSTRMPMEPKIFRVVYVPMTPAHMPYHPYAFNGAQQSTEAVFASINPAAPVPVQRINNSSCFPVAQDTAIPQCEQMHDEAHIGRNRTGAISNNNAHNDMVNN